ncbi:nuclear transport factor 2 family protein [Temperatibacter marinus]|uniref:Nuclear transport factor 2 family protein n=1 Tax=Temperatibacter marinus TaxID=1456591 RepID=A0AA52HBL3_9PROT|nr:nuclear transport factor 2 family protein [Temperatibacter marinus]WND03758.1 nuclear transport factor 2 family protein [Temperatibacter marinus]
MEPKEVLCLWVEAFNEGDVDKLAALYAKDAINHQVAQEPITGKHAIRDAFTAEFENAEMVCIVENIFQEGEWAIMEWKDPKGFRGCGFFHIVKGLIVFQRGYWDKLSFLKANNLPIPQ